ncbi:MAG: hypothetical protein ACTHMM_17740 [Agriterribacter sp.]
MITALFVAIAAMLCALMDRVENENFYESIFRDRNERFWYKRVSWKYAKKIFGWKADAWHIAKSMMIFSLAFAIVFYKPVLLWWIDWVVIGAIWISVFNVFYNKIFRK